MRQAAAVIILISVQPVPDRAQQQGTEDGWRVSKDLSIFGVSMLTHGHTYAYLLTMLYVCLLTPRMDKSLLTLHPA